jgi:fructoselysine 6-kinase
MGERFGIEGTWQGGLYESFYLSESDWSLVARQDLIAIPANNPNFAEMLRRKTEDQLLAVDYLDIENKIPLMETVESTDIAFITASVELLPQYKKIAFSRKKLIVVTLGAKGSYAFDQGKTYFQPALPVPKVLDTTGCGDAYQAAFALSYYLDNNIEKAMYKGAQAASLILQYWGGVGKEF